MLHMSAADYSQRIRKTLILHVLYNRSFGKHRRHKQNPMKQLFSQFEIVFFDNKNHTQFLYENIYFIKQVIFTEQAKRLIYL